MAKYSPKTKRRRSRLASKIKSAGLLSKDGVAVASVELKSPTLWAMTYTIWGDGDKIRLSSRSPWVHISKLSSSELRRLSGLSWLPSRPAGPLELLAGL